MPCIGNPWKVYKSKKSFLPVFIIITGLSVLLCGCDLSPHPIKPIEDYNRWYLRKDNNYSDEEWDEVQTVLGQLKEYKITLPERFLTLEDAQHIVEQRTRLDNGDDFGNEPVTVTMYPIYDYGDRVLSAKYNGLSEIINHTDQHVIYFQIGNDKQFKEALTLLTTNLQVADKYVLILTGHGNVKWLRWNSGSDSSVTFDPDDYNDTGLLNLLHSLPVELVIFHSCDAGEGGEKQDNQANRLARHIRIGGTVLAPYSTVVSIICAFDKNSNKITDVRYTFSAFDTFQTAAVPYRVKGTWN